MLIADTYVMTWSKTGCCDTECRDFDLSYSTLLLFDKTRLGFTSVHFLTTLSFFSFLVGRDCG